MPYVDVWVHYVWSTKNRFPYLTEEIIEPVLNHIRENARKKKIHLDTIGGYRDHVHALVCIRHSQSISRIAQLLKGEVSFWINQQSLTAEQFEWQREYWVESVDKKRLARLREYIVNQEAHHKDQITPKYHSLPDAH